MIRATETIVAERVKGAIENVHVICSGGDLNSLSVGEIVRASCYGDRARGHVDAAFGDVIPCIEVRSGLSVGNFDLDGHNHVADRADADCACAVATRRSTASGFHASDRSPLASSSCR